MCAECAVDPVLVEIVKQGEEGICVVCGAETMTASVEELAEPVLRAYNAFVKPADEVHDPDDESDNPHLVQGGKSPNVILQELLECEPDAANVFLEELSALDWRSVKDGGDDLFAPDQYGYQLEPPVSDKYDRRWRAFERSVKHDGRFFNDRQRLYLKRLFAPLLRGELSGGRPPLVAIGAEGSIVTTAFRAREASDKNQRARIYEQPAREMGPPPPHLRKQGRMNAAGIGVFYGSSDAQTCVAELRVPVGGAAIVGEFSFVRPVTILDLRQLEGSAVPPGMSWLQDDFAEQYTYATFMRRLHDLIRRPVLPDAESIDYLPTQIIAEYLASLDEPRIDGLLFTSSQRAYPTRSEDDEALQTDGEGLNIVLFARAAVVEGHDAAPIRRITDVRPYSVEDDETGWGLNDESVDYEPLPPPVPDEDDHDDGGMVLLDDGDSTLPSANGGFAPTLRITDDGLRVVHVKGVVYDIAERDVGFLDDTEPPRF